MNFKAVDKELNFPVIEHRILDFWQKNGIFALYQQKNRGKKKWSFQDGPITANNPMGVHHAWGRTYKDIFQRYRTMKGFEQRYQNGFDCQGLWVEVEVEKELGFNSKRDIEKYGIDRFVEKCKERVHKYSMVQTEQSIRLGMWMDWGEWKTELNDPDWLKKSHSYYTLSEPNNYTIWYFLKKCFERGYIYKGVDVMPWCARCGTAISDMEIATEGYKELSHKAIYIRFPIHGRAGEYLLVWTTTPWTLTSNTGCAVHPDLSYVRVRTADGIYYLAKNLTRVLQPPFEVLAEMPGRELLDWTYDGPYDHLPIQKGVVHRVIPWSEVSEADGTGIVHIAPGCGKEDFLLGKEFNLTTIAPLDEAGVYLAGFDWLTGREVKDVGRPIIEDLKQRGVLYRVEDYSHRYPVCWRCDSELIFRLVDEWFISMKELRQEIMESTRQVERWIPDFGFEREMDWLRNMADWCISKKRYWGLALPIWECACGHFTVVGSRDELKNRAAAGWSDFEGHPPHRPWVDLVKIKCDKCGQLMSRIPDVGNPWLDAGIVPFSTIRPPADMQNLTYGYPFDKTYWQEWFPADFITECFPGQFRNWFYAILTMSTVLEKRPPFKVLLGHALVRDEHGEEMHKSKGNAIWFDDAAEKMGADVMRWMFARHNPVQNLNFGYGPATDIKKTLLTLWNVYSFFITYARIDGFHPSGKKLSDRTLPKLDRWLVSRLNTLIRTADHQYAEYDLMPLVKEIELFFDDLSNWYLRRNRKRFWKSDNDDDKETAYLVLYQTLVTLIKLISPIIPFLSEEMYQNLICQVDPGAPISVHLNDFPVSDESLIDEKLEREASLARKAVSLGRAARNKANIKVRQPLSELIIDLGPNQQHLEPDDIAVILDELNIKRLKVCGPGALEDYYTMTAQPRFEKLGPRLGSLLNPAAQQIKTWTAAEIKEFMKTGSRSLPIDGQTVTVTTEEIEIRRTGKLSWAVAFEEEIGVGVNTTITPELENEGLVRELIHKIQALRKEANFNLVDRIHISCQTSDKLQNAISHHADYLKSETLALEIRFEKEPGEISRELDINGIKTVISLTRIKG